MSTGEHKQKSFIRVKPYSLCELGKLYGVDWRTLKRWLEPFISAIGERRGRFYTIPQVKIIFDKLGLPSVIETD